MSDERVDTIEMAGLDGLLSEQDSQLAAITARRKVAARTIEEDFDGTQALPSYTEARA